MVEGARGIDPPSALRAATSPFRGIVGTTRPSTITRPGRNARSALPPEVQDRRTKCSSSACDKELMLATAESCTAGCGGAVTDVPGCKPRVRARLRGLFQRGEVRLLGLDRAMIDDCGAVSAKVPRGDGAGGLRRSKADIALSITGFAGPAGDDARRASCISPARDRATTPAIARNISAPSGAGRAAGRRSKWRSRCSKRR